MIENACIPKSCFYYHDHSLDDVMIETIDDFIVELYDKTYRGSNIPNYTDDAVPMNITIY